jgi:thiol:disulfide interchange protein DsbA
MVVKKMFVLLVLIILISLSAQAEQAPSIKGVYSKLPWPEYKFDGKTVEVIEFLSFYCHSCYSFERSIPIIKGNFPKKINWKVIPIYWGEGSSKPGEAYLLAEELGKGEEMKKAIFNAHFVERKDIGNIEVLESIGRQLGLGKDFGHRLRAGDMADKARKALEMARMYRVDETPTVIIAGNIMTNPHPFNHNIDAFRENVLMIINSILRPSR